MPERRRNLQEESLSLFDRPPAATQGERVLKVKDLARLAREVLEQNFPSVIVEGEVSNFKRHMPSGHLYFTLKDDEAQVRVVMWRSDAARVRFDVTDGMKILVNGRISLYEPRGDFQLYAVNLMPAGQGALQLAFEQLKKKLEDEGLFAEEHKKPIPEFPSRIGVVTSLEGAAVRDIISIVNRRFPAVELVIYPVKVQGDGAAEEISNAIRGFNKLSNVDVLIVGRGGGSLEDLWAFNEEIVARAIFDSRIPVISAVGHQVDFTISDFVADVRAATPSAAAELVVPDRLEIAAGIQAVARNIGRAIGQNLDRLTLELDKLSHHYALRQPMSLVDQKTQLVDELARRLESESVHYLEALNQRMSSIYSHLNALNPTAVLRRGYAIVESALGIVSSVRNIDAGERATIRLHDGTLDTQITGKSERSVGHEQKR
jgi:exodeoxyribonuclease VII large subunit